MTTVVLGVLALLVLAGVALPRVGRVAEGLPAQVLAGVLCGVVGALVAAAPYVDLVPDDLESGHWAAAAAVATAAVVAVSEHRRRRRARQVPRRRLTPGAPRSSAKRTHSGP